MFGGFCNEEKRETTAGLAGTFYSCVDGHGLFHRHGGVCGHLRSEQGQCDGRDQRERHHLCDPAGQYAEGRYARNDKDDILHDYQDKTGVTITSGGEKTSNTITVETAKDQTTDVTLENVHIEVNTTRAKSGAIEIKGDGDTNLELNGDNTVLVENEWSEEHAAIEKADKYGTGTLTIKDDVNDNGTEKSGTEADTTGKLLAGATIILPPSAAVAIRITGNIL